MRLTKNIKFTLLAILVYGGLTAQDRTLSFPESRFAEVDGAKIHYRHFAVEDSLKQGTVLLVHGFAGSTFCWRFVTDTLTASGFDVVAVDIPPFGYSDKSPKLNQSNTARALLLEQFISEIFPGRSWHLVGHSMGGAIVEALAIISEEDICSVTFVGGAIFTSLKPEKPKPPLLLRNGITRGLLLVVVKPLLLNRVTLKRFLSSAYGREPLKHEVLGYLKPLKERGTSRAILRSMAVSEELFPLHADSVHLPVLAVWGDEDTWVPAKNFVEALDHMSESRLKIIPGAAHVPMETHPQEFIAVLMEFLIEAGK